MAVSGISESQEHQDNTTSVRTASPATDTAKQRLPMAKSIDSQSVLKRLQTELMALMMCGDPGISAFPDGDNIFSWKGTITGSKDTVYEGMVYKVSLSFSTEYPFKPPKVKFESMCFHPNVDTQGNICLDILKDKWSSAYDVRTVLLSIQSLLGEPNNDSPLNTQAAALWSNQEEFRKKLEKPVCLNSHGREALHGLVTATMYNDIIPIWKDPLRVPFSFFLFSLLMTLYPPLLIVL